MLRDPKGNTGSGGGGIFRALYPPDKELVLGWPHPPVGSPRAGALCRVAMAPTPEADGLRGRSKPRGTDTGPGNMP